MKELRGNKIELRRIVIETVATIAICALVFAGVTQAASSALTNQTRTVSTASSLKASSQSVRPNVPSGYVKADYTVQLGQYSKQPAAKDISKEEAAEIGAQNLWKLFDINLNGKIIEMTYNPVTSTQLRADWTGSISINANLSYWFSIDAVTGECRTSNKAVYWDKGVNVGMDKSLLTNHQEFDSLAKDIAEKYQLVPGKITSAEYYGQGYSTSPSGGTNADVEIRVKSENGQQAQLSFSRYNKEFLGVAYDCWVKDVTIMEEQIQKKQMEEDKGVNIEIYDHKVKDAQNVSGFWLKINDESK